MRNKAPYEIHVAVFAVKSVIKSVVKVIAIFQGLLLKKNPISVLQLGSKGLWLSWNVTFLFSNKNALISHGSPSALTAQKKTTIGNICTL